MKLLPRSVFFFLLCSTAFATTVDESFGPRWFFQPPENLGPVVNSSFGEYNPEISADGLTLIFASNRLGGFGVGDLWQTTRFSLDAPWSEPVNLGASVNSSAAEDSPGLSADGLTLLIQTTRSGGVGDWDTWQSTRPTVAHPWGAPVNLGSPLNSTAIDAGAELSADGLTLYFLSTRAGGFGNFDLWQATRPTAGSPWNTPTNMGSELNTQFYDANPDITADGLVLFHDSNRFGESDGQLVYSTRPDTSTPWTSPQRLNAATRGPGYEIAPSATANGKTIVFRSNRPGGEGDDDLWTTTARAAFAFTRFGDVPVAEHTFVASGHELGFRTDLIEETGGAEPFVGVVGGDRPRLRMQSVHARTIFDAVDLSNHDSVEFAIDVHNTQTSWEIEDFVSVSLSDGVQTISVLGLDTPAGLDAAEGSWQNYRVLIPDDWTHATLTITSRSDSSQAAEHFDFDNIAFFGTPVPEPSGAVLLLSTGIFLTCRRGRQTRRAWLSGIHQP